MIQLKHLIRASILIVGAMVLVSCNSKQTNLPAFAPATQVVVADYTPAKDVNPRIGKVWTVTNPVKVAQLVQLADANGKGWRDENAENRSGDTGTGIVITFTGTGLDQVFAIDPNGFSNSLGTSRGNLWSHPNTANAWTLIKELPEAELEKLLTDVRAVLRDVKPDATPAPMAPKN